MKEKQTFIMENESAFKALFQYASIGILILDKNGFIKNINPVGLEILGYEKNELLARPLEILIPEKLRLKHQDHFNDYIKNPKARRMGEGLEFRALNKNGNEIPVEISIGHFIVNEEKLATLHHIF